MRRTSALMASLFVLLTACGEGSEGDAALAGENVVVLTGARLIDGTGGAPIENATIVIQGDRIQSVGATGSVEIPDGAETIDLTGKTIMPGIINLHGHLAQTADNLVNSVDNYTEENVRAKLDLYARYGVLHLVSLGRDQPIIFGIRDRQRAGEFGGARVYTAGEGFGVAAPGYPPVQPGIEGPEEDVYRPSTPDEAREGVRALAAQKADFVKMWVDDLFGTIPPLPRAIYDAVIDEGHKNGLRVTAHVFKLSDAKGLVAGGIDGLAHSVRDQPVDTALINAMKERNVFSIATLVREESEFIYTGRPPYLDDPFFTANVTDSVEQTLASEAFQSRPAPNAPRYRDALRMAQQNLKTLFDSGVRVGFGTDSGPLGRFEGYFEHRELELMVEGGLTPMQAIQIASSNSAEILGIDTDYGTIEPGKMAEFLVLGANPLESISNTKSLEQVWQAGRRNP